MVDNDYEEPLKAGDHFGDYVVEWLLGKGAMGAVYLVRAPDDSLFAVKVMFPGKMTHDLRSRFAHEADFAMKIRHRNLISVYDVGEDPETGLCYIIMDYVSGGTLSDRIKAQGRLSVDEAVKIAMQIAAALDVAHRNGLVHRDVKPDNIMFDADGTPKLADLGVAKFDDDRKTMVTMTGMVIGTPAYMSPEQLMDSHRIDARADIYSLGVVLYEMLAGTRPNSNSTAVELLAKAIKGEELPDIRKMCPEISAAVAHVLSLMCAPKPEERPATSIEAANLLHKAVTGRLAIPKKPPKSGAEIMDEKTAERKRAIAVWMVVAGLLLFLVVGLAGIAYAVLRYYVEEPAQPQSAATKKAEGSMSMDSMIVTSVVEKVAVVTNVVERVAIVTNVEHAVATQNAMEPSNAVRVANADKHQKQSTKQSKITRKGRTDRRVRYCKVDGITWYYTLNDGDAVIWRGQNGYNNETRPALDPSDMEHVVVPSEIGGYKVSTIGSLAFFRCRMKSVVIPEGVRRIAGWAFYDCNRLKDIRLPSSLDTLDSSPFSSCKSLTSIDIGNCSNFSGSAFGYCPISHVTVSESNPSCRAVGDCLYSRDMRKLIFFPRTGSSVTLPESVDEIGDGAFLTCNMLQEVKLGGNVVKIGASAFSMCGQLAGIELSPGLREVGNRAFAWSALRKITFPASVEKIGTSLFDRCRSLRTVQFLGDAPKIDMGRTSVLGNAPEDLEIVVRRGSKGWKEANSTVLPDRWPDGGFDDSRKIRYADEVQQLEKRTQKQPEVLDAETWQQGPSDLWFVEWDKAWTAAKKSNKKLFVLNTGSDWCHWCQKLRAEVLETQRFIDYAKKNLVLVYLDSPSRNPLCKDQKMHNREIVKALEFSGGVPLAMIVTPTGKRLGVITGGGPTVDAYVERIKAVIKGKSVRIGNDSARILFQEGGYQKLKAKIAAERAKLPPVTKEDFKATLTGVAVVDAKQRHNPSGVKFLPPETHLVVPFGKSAVFRVEYDFPKGYGARVWTRDDWPAAERGNSYYFGSNPSGLYRGKGTAYGFLSLLERGKACTLKTLAIRTKSDPELEDSPRGWDIGSATVHLDFKTKHDTPAEAEENKEDTIQPYVSKDKLHALYRAKDRKHVFVEVCHQHVHDSFKTPPFTLDRVREAISIKADILFFTLARSKDGVLFSAERENLERISNGSGSFGDYTAAQLKRMRVKHRDQLTTKSFATLEDMIRIGRGKILFKVAGFREHTKELEELLDRLDAWESVMVESWEVPADRRACHPGMWNNICSGKLQVTAIGNSFKDWKEVMAEPTASGAGEDLQERGMLNIPERVFVAFTYGPGKADRTDDEAGWEKALKEGVTVFRTNRPKELVKYLKKKKRRNW